MWQKGRFSGRNFFIFGHRYIKVGYPWKLSTSLIQWAQLNEWKTISCMCFWRKTLLTTIREIRPYVTVMNALHVITIDLFISVTLFHSLIPVLDLRLTNSSHLSPGPGMDTVDVR